MHEQQTGCAVRYTDTRVIPLYSYQKLEMKLCCRLHWLTNSGTVWKIWAVIMLTLQNRMDYLAQSVVIDYRQKYQNLITCHLSSVSCSVSH